MGWVKSGYSTVFVSHLRCCPVWGPGEQNGGRGPSLLPVGVALSFTLLTEEDASGAGLLPGWEVGCLSLRWGTLEEEPGGDRT